MEYLKGIGRIRPHARRVVEILSGRLDLKVCDLTFAKVVDVALREKWVRDPFDRLIVGHAKAKGAALVTKDEQILANYRPAVW